MSTNTHFTMTEITKSFDISQLPSLKDGMTLKEEAMKRRKTCRFIEEAGRVLKLPRVAIATAIVFFHRFYAKHSFQEHDRFEVAVACIVLAAKTEESPKKLNLVIDECHKLKVRGMQAGRISTGGASPSSPPPPSAMDPKGEDFMKLKERILLLERVILHTIGFELSIDHPYKFLVELIKQLVHKREVEYIQKDPAIPPPQALGKMMNEMVQYAMNFANDSMHTSLCLQFDPHTIAVACVFMAANFAKVRPVSKDWLELLGYPSVEALGSICVQVIELIAERRGADPSMFQKIRQNLETLKKTGARKAPPPPAPDAKRPRTE